LSVASRVYEENIRLFSDHLKILRRRANLLSILRLIAFFLFSFSIYRCVIEFRYTCLLYSSALFVLFLILVRISFRLKDQRLLFEKLVFINTNELQVLAHAPNQFPDGRHFLAGASWLDDLDIFGPGSLYHLLNRATTSHGEEKLAAILKNPSLQKGGIEQTQEAVKRMAEQLEKRQMISAKGMAYEEKEGNMKEVNSWLQTRSLLYKKSWLRILAWVLPAFNLSAAYYYLATDQLLPLALGIASSWSITGFFLSYINQQHAMLSKKQPILDQYTSILRAFSQVEPGSSVLLQALEKESVEAHHSIHRLSRLSQYFDQRLNMLVNFLLNSFLLYDIHCIIALENWKEKNKSKLPEWIHCVGSIECLNSLAAFAYNNPGYVYPLVFLEKTSISARQIAHPLLSESERVANDFEIGKDDRLQLITGSNMSGKTTFLRTVGVNILLAQCGAPVCATSFQFTPVRILSSVRISDSLQEHTSFFMAELKRLKEIIGQLEEGLPALVLIDEILRGTNSEDKSNGSEKFIQKLLQYPCLTLFATHDLSLGSMEHQFPGQISNYCFESNIENGALHFDYTLRPGIAKNKNASFLMKKMGII
jgi:MutS domain V